MFYITATDLPRFMACNGSRLVGSVKFPTDGDDTVRKEGDAAHWLVTQVHSGAHAAVELIDRKAPNGVYITAEMVEYLDDYLIAMSPTDTAVEVNTSYGNKTWQVNGRADSIRYDENEYKLYVNELKYGWRIVEPENNWVLISHAIGWVAQNPSRRVDSIIMTIYQPRPNHPGGRVRSWDINEITLTGLSIIINETLTAPTDQLNTGPHCYRCPSLAFCPAARAAQYNAIEASERAFTEDIDNPTLSGELDLLKRAISVLQQKEKAYSELALYRLRKGEVIENYSLENELTNRQWKDHVTPDLMQVLTGKDLTKKQLITPNQVEKSGVSKEVVAALTTRHNKGTKLVRVDANIKAQKIFGKKGK